jgi:hypothetical protein
VHDRFNFVPGEDSFQLSPIREIDLSKNRAERDSGTMAFEQAVQGNDGHAARDQNFRADAADVTRRAGNKNIHLSILLDLGRKPNGRAKLTEPTARPTEKHGEPKRKSSKD